MLNVEALNPRDCIRGVSMALLHLLEHTATITETRHCYRILFVQTFRKTPEGYVRIKATIVLRKELVGTERVAFNVVCLRK